MSDIVGAITSASSKAIKELREMEARRAELLKTAKADALSRAEQALQELKELGFNYRLVEESDTPAPTRQRRARSSGVRDEVLATIKQSTDGLAPSDIIEQMGAKGDKKRETSIRNALAALKKDGSVTNTDGHYTVTDSDTTQ